jgi:hypothetical protein
LFERRLLADKSRLMLKVVEQATRKFEGLTQHVLHRVQCRGQCRTERLTDFGVPVDQHQRYRQTRADGQFHKRRDTLFKKGRRGSV